MGDGEGRDHQFPARRLAEPFPWRLPQAPTITHERTGGMTQDNTNRGAIWKNDKKERDTHPDFKGELDVDGRKYWVSAWRRREDASPKAPALSFSIKPKED